MPMKQIEAIIAWTPHRWSELKPETAGEGKRCWVRAGASSSALPALSEEARIARLFIEFQTLVVRDGIDPQAAHRAFLGINEYRSRIAPDTDGAEFEDPPEED